MAKNIGTSGILMRVEMAAQEKDFIIIYLLNEFQQTVWVYDVGQWVDYSDGFPQIWGQWYQTFQEYTAQLSGWNGGDWVYIDPNFGNKG